jgi:hypothetical protein
MQLLDVAAKKQKMLFTAQKCTSAGAALAWAHLTVA